VAESTVSGETHHFPTRTSQTTNAKRHKGKNKKKITSCFLNYLLFKIIFFYFKKLFLILIYQNNLKILKQY
jgi:hypothetical protein